jgi:DNA-binding transcriptional LysR family regulator
MASIITLRHLRSFVAIAETGSFTRAAERLFLTQSSLTTTIQQLEDDAGVKLFDRTTRSVTPTPAAARFLEQAERLLSDFDTMLGDLQSVARSNEGHLRIAASPSVVAWLLAPSLPSFRSAYPNVTLSIRDAGSAEIERRVREGQVDFGICSRLSSHQELDYTPLLKDRYGVVCSADHPLATLAGPLSWAKVSAYKHDWVGLASDTQVGSLHRETLQQFGMMSCPEEVSSSTSLYSMLILGNRFSVVPSLTRYSHQLDTFIFRELDDPPIERELCLVTRKLRSMSPSAERLLQALLQTLHERGVPQGEVFV